MNDEVSGYIKNLSSYNIEERETALEKLIEMGDDIVPILIRQIQRDDRLTKMEASWALGVIGNKTACAPLLDNLNKGDPYVARYSAAALGMIGSDEAVVGLISIIKNEAKINVWNYAVMALGSIGDKRAVAELEKLMENNSVFIRFSAKRALERINQRGKY